MSTELYQGLLDSFKKANKEARERIANKAGYPTGSDYKAYLESKISGKDVIIAPKKKPTPVVAITPTIHNVHILDRSGSMHGGKMNNAVEGINKEIETLKKDSTVIYKQTTVTFNTHATTIDFLKPIAHVTRLNASADGGTALFDTIGDTINKLTGNVGEGEKVLIKIFTDGQENSSTRYTANTISNLIKSVENKGFTVTFVGTQSDVNYVTRMLNVDLSNTLVHDNTPQGVAESFSRGMGATMMYASDLKAGKDVSKGFYTKKLVTTK